MSKIDESELNIELSEEFGQLATDLLRTDTDNMSDDFVYHCGFNRYEADIAAGNVINYENNLHNPISLTTFAESN